MRAWFRRDELDGYLRMDHRESPGLPGLARRWGLPIGRGTLFETAIATCSHCQAQVVKPPDRARDRPICPKCDKYLCAGCRYEYHLTGVCYPWLKRLEDVARQAALDQINRAL